MTENEPNVNEEETAEPAVEDAVAEQAESSPSEEAAQAAAEEARAEEAAAAPPAQPAPAAASPEGERSRAEGESAADLPPKERRRRARSTHTGERRPQRTAAERARERAEQRRRRAQHRRAYRQRVRERRTAEGPRGETPAVEPKSTGRKKLRQGIVVSDRADKTITVRIDVARRHRMYKKIVRTSSTLHVHDENNDAHIGDTVRVVESRPLSRTKRWRLVDILERAR
jgi:small subunit ribosomal protein S17